MALLLLWTAWLVSVAAWIVHLHEVRSLDADLYSLAGLPAGLVQAALIYLIGRGNNVARRVVVFVAVPAFIVVMVFFAGQFGFSPARLGTEAVLRGVAVVLLLTPGAARWFRRAGG